MSLREWMLAGLLAVAAGLVVRGLFEWSDGAGWVGSGVLLAAWCWFVLADDAKDVEA